MSARLAKCPGCQKTFSLPNFSRAVRAECPKCNTHFTWPPDEPDKKKKKKQHGLRGADDPLIGEEFGGCTITELLGHGSLGSVYRAKHPDQDEDVALKILPPFLTKRFPQFISRYMAQCRRVADLNHPNVVPVYQVGEHRGFIFTTMKFINGKSLEECLGSKNSVKPESAIKLMRSAAFGLRAMADSGVLHRNLKPGNIILSRDTKVYVADFGLGPGSSAELKGSVFGTAIINPNYLSPEQSAGDSIDWRSDIYSFGAILYRMVTGTTPFEELEGGAARAFVEPARERNKKVPEDVSHVIAHMMEVRPDDRFASWKEVIDALDSLTNGTLSEIPTQLSLGAPDKSPPEVDTEEEDSTDTERHDAISQVLSMLPGTPPPTSSDKAEPAGFDGDRTVPPSSFPQEEETMPPTRSPFYNPDKAGPVPRPDPFADVDSFETPNPYDSPDPFETFPDTGGQFAQPDPAGSADSAQTVDYSAPTRNTEQTHPGRSQPFGVDPAFDEELSQQLTDLSKGPYGGSATAAETVDQINPTVTYVTDNNEPSLPAPPPPAGMVARSEQALEPLPHEHRPPVDVRIAGQVETPYAPGPTAQSGMHLDPPAQFMTPSAPLETVAATEQYLPTLQSARTANTQRRSGVYERKRTAKKRETLALVAAVITSAVFIFGALIIWSIRQPDPAPKRMAAKTTIPPRVNQRTVTGPTHSRTQTSSASKVDRTAAVKKTVTDRMNKLIAVHKWGEAIRSMEAFARTQTSNELADWAVQMTQRIQAKASTEYMEIVRRAQEASAKGNSEEARDFYQIVFLNYDLKPYVNQARNSYAALLEAQSEAAPSLVTDTQSNVTVEAVTSVAETTVAETPTPEPVLKSPNFLVLDAMIAQWRFDEAKQACEGFLDDSYEQTEEVKTLHAAVQLFPRLKTSIIEHVNRLQVKRETQDLFDPPVTGKIFRATDRSMTIQSGVKVSTVPWDRLHVKGMWLLAMDAVSPADYKVRLAAAILAAELESPETAGEEIRRLKAIGVDVSIYEARLRHKQAQRMRRLGVE